MGGEAVRYVILKYLPEDEHLQTRAIRDVCLKVPDTCAPAVEKVLTSRDTIAQKNALYVASEVAMPSLEPVLSISQVVKTPAVWYRSTRNIPTSTFA